MRESAALSVDRLHLTFKRFNLCVLIFFTMGHLTELLIPSVPLLELCKKDLLFFISWGKNKSLAFHTRGSICCSATWCWEVDFAKDLAFSQMVTEWTFSQTSMWKEDIRYYISKIFPRCSFDFITPT